MPIRKVLPWTGRNAVRKAARTACTACLAWRSRLAKRVTTYGSARWAEPEEVRAAGLTQPVGVFLGRLRTKEGDYLRHEGPEHVMAFAPTRSGKGVGLVVPTLLSWPGSTVVHDIKGENWQLTAGWRARFSHCLLFNPTDGRSAAYNPLLEVRRGMHEVRDVQNIADILVDPEGALERRNHWEKTSHALLVGAILHVLYPCCRSLTRSSLLPPARRDAHHRAQPIDDLSACRRGSLSGTGPPGWTGCGLAVRFIATVGQQPRGISGIRFAGLRLGGALAAAVIRVRRACDEDQAAFLFSFKWRTLSARTGSLPFARSSRKSAHSCTISRRCTRNVARS